MKIACYLVFIHTSLAFSCTSPPSITEQVVNAQHEIEGAEVEQPDVEPGIYAFFDDVSSLEGKRIAVVANHTSIIDGIHLVDSLLGSGLKVERIFSPEHGFRGNVADGVTINDQMDTTTGLAIVSLYGKNKKPSADQLSGIDIVIFDIQDVGARFYTFLSTLHYVMEACAENGVEVMVLDRPNPNIHYVDGPVLEMQHSSFVGLHPVPVVYGMTIGEYALMINGEAWLKGGVKCKLQVVPCSNYTRNRHYHLPIPPSPNLPDMTAVYLYPSLCFFEGTQVSIGRGTTEPFKIIGEPGNTRGDFSFTPVAIKGVSDHPPHKGVGCNGYNLTSTIDVSSPIDSLNIEWLCRMYQESSNKDSFFLKSGFFEKLAGSSSLRIDVISGKPPVEIRKSWQADVEKFKVKRLRYLIYAEY